MKLEEVRIDSSYTGRPINLGRFSESLTFVYGENSAGKSSTNDLVRQLLFGHTRTQNPIPGELTVFRKGQKLRLRRSNDPHNTLRIESLEGYERHPVLPTEHELTANVTPDIYDTLYNVSFRHTSQNAIRLARVLRDEFQVPLGPAAAGDDAARISEQRELDAVRDRLASLEQKIADLTVSRRTWLEQQESNQLTLRRKLAEVESEIRNAQDRLSQIQLSSLHEQLSAVVSEIESLRLRIDTAQDEVIYPTEDPTSEHLVSLYERLDEIDNQIHRWRHVQSDIQSQRLRLRDEMLVWNDLTLESDQHPYHIAREILVGLEQKVDQAERNAQHWASAGGARVDKDQMARSLGELCQSMRDDLYGLCSELSHQYKHIRHKSAAAELKQLRRCYTEMGENIERLVHRRASLVREIREIDPAGADAIVRADAKFCQCAQHEGYLEARRRYVGPTVKPQAIRVAPDLTSERARLAECEAKRRELLDRIAGIETENNAANARLAELNRQRESLVVQLADADESRVSRFDREIADLNRDADVLRERLARPIALPQTHPLIQQASNLLERMTAGQLNRVFVERIATGSHPTLFVRTRQDHAQAFETLDTDRQDQVYLALMLAGKEYLRQHKGVELPTTIDDSFCHISNDRVTPTLDVVHQASLAGHQIVLLTQHRYLADRLPGVPVLSLDQPLEQRTEKSSASPLSPKVIRYGDNDWARQNQFDDVYFDSSAPRPYPLSKYPRNHSVSQPEPRIYSIPDEEPGFRAAFNPQDFPASNYSPVPVELVGDPIKYLPAYNENTPLEHTGLFEASHLRRLADLRLYTVDSLLTIDQATMEELGISRDLIDRWQSQLWLLINVPNLSSDDARVLVACGVTEPQQLATSHLRQLEERIERFLATSSGRRGGFHNYRLNRDRISGWLRALESTRNRWQHRRRPQATQRQFEPRKYQRDDRDYTGTRSRAFGSATRDSENRERRPLQPRPPRMHSQARDNDRDYISRQNRSAARTQDTDLQANRESAGNSSRSKPKTKRRSGSTPNSPVSSSLKFHLDLDDHIEAAPSIGPKTAERFEKIGVVTVRDFLKQTAESMATKLNYKRLNADLLLQWQQQARMVCRIPNMRGHDAQLLVACDIIDPEELAAMQPEKLFAIIDPFSDTKEGLKIIRGGKKPDLEEVTDWITWAGDTRSIQAA